MTECTSVPKAVPAGADCRGMGASVTDTTASSGGTTSLGSSTPPTAGMSRAAVAAASSARCSMRALMELNDHWYQVRSMTRSAIETSSTSVPPPEPASTGGRSGGRAVTAAITPGRASAAGSAEPSVAWVSSSPSGALASLGSSEVQTTRRWRARVRAT